MFQSLDLFGLSCLFLTVTCQGGQILQPQNVSLVWFSDFEIQLSWAHPQDSREDCTYKVEWPPFDGHHAEIDSPPWKGIVRMDRGFLQVSVKTVCDSNESLPVYKNFTYPELVRNLECNIHSSTHTRCSWIPVSQHSPSFFYQLVNLGGEDEHFPLQACSLNTHNGRTGCDLHANVFHKIHILINETRDNETSKNIFYLNFQVKHPALNWTVTKARNEFIINWTQPDFGQWTFIINYIECSENKTKDIGQGTSYNLPRVPHCGYNMMIKAKWDNWETPWSTPYQFDADADTNYNVLLAATIITPLLIVSLAALLFVCWRKYVRNKNSIFPKVPEPRDLLSDISDNNNKSNVPNLYIPAEEEENCKITLVLDPQNNKLDS